MSTPTNNTPSKKTAAETPLVPPRFPRTPDVVANAAAIESADVISL
jgi:hypothetical protein